LWCLRYAGNVEDAADLAQEVLTRVWRNLDSFQGSSRFTTWLYTITRNHCLNYVKARANRPECASDQLLESLVHPLQRDIADDLEMRRRRALVRAWIDETLDETERRAVVLHYGEELSLSTVTRLLGLTNPSGAKAYIVSARRKLEAAARSFMEGTDAKSRQRNDS